jgi:hypothetical protein
MQTKQALEHGPGTLPLEAFPDQVEDLRLPRRRAAGGPSVLRHPPADHRRRPRWCLGLAGRRADRRRPGAAVLLRAVHLAGTRARAVALYRTRFKPRSGRPSASRSVSPRADGRNSASPWSYVWRFRRGAVPSRDRRGVSNSQPGATACLFDVEGRRGSPATVKRAWKRSPRSQAKNWYCSPSPRLRRPHPPYELVARQFGLVE